MTDQEEFIPPSSSDPSEKNEKSAVNWSLIKSLGWRRWFYLPRIFSRTEKVTILILSVFAVVSFSILAKRTLDRITVPMPDVGGELREGVIREPRFINPIYASNDTDRDLTNLVFSKLIRYDYQGNVVMDLARSIETSQDGKVYTIQLRQGVRWHDDEDLTADDVVFTIKTIQDPEYKSPLRQNWQGVIAEKADETTVRLTLRQAYAPFLENLSLGIIPEHLWRRIPRETSILSDLNLKPIGSGPYKFENLTRRGDGSLISVALARNKKYYLTGPFIKDVRFLFYKDEPQLIAAYRRNEIDSFFITSSLNARELNPLGAEVHELHLPKIFAVFLNPNTNQSLARKAVRQALYKAINREDIIAKTAPGGGVIANSAVPEGTFGYNPDIAPTINNLDEARNILAKDGWKESADKGVLERTEGSGKNRKIQALQVRITTSDAPELAKAADLIAESWRSIGVQTEVKTMPVNDLETSMIRPRAYEALLFGEVFGHDPDPFAFWHTSQLKDPGLNIALYSNRNVDQLLEDARLTTDNNLREKKYREFQKIISDEIGALFLYTPTDYYAMSKRIKGVNIGSITLPEERLDEINFWYVDTRRALKRAKDN